jgi:hypothetical protein
MYGYVHMVMCVCVFMYVRMYLCMYCIYNVCMSYLIILIYFTINSGWNQWVFLGTHIVDFLAKS